MVFCTWCHVNDVVAGVLIHSGRMYDDACGGGGGGGDTWCALSRHGGRVFFLRSYRFASVATSSIHTSHSCLMLCMQHQ